jgi:hypothetical protein
MHHRFPTSTVNVRRAAHPFTTKAHFGNHEYVLVHNGHIANAAELKEEHEKLGIGYYSVLDDGTFNDSEALLWDFARYIEGQQDKLVAYGGIAFICMKLVDGALDKLYFGRNTNPLNMDRSKYGLILSSEGPGEEIAADTLHTYNYALKRLTKRELKINRFAPYVQVVTNYTYPYAASSTLSNRDYWDDDELETEGYYNAQGHWVYWEEEEDNVCRQERRVADRIGKYLAAKPDSEYKVAQMVWDYLNEADGYFENAYLLAEHDYLEFCEDTEDYTTNSYIKQEQRFYELVLDKLTNDPGYVDENSVASPWDELLTAKSKAQEIASWI